MLANRREIERICVVLGRIALRLDGLDRSNCMQ